jgi:signal recognition particle subunit SRP54
VNQLVERFLDAQKMMRQMRSGMGMPGMPGLPGASGSKKAKGRASAQQQVRGKKSRSGNPAKRAQEQAAAASAPAGLPAGLEGLDPAAFDPSMLDPEALKKMGDLPPAFKDLLGGT